MDADQGIVIPTVNQPTADWLFASEETVGLELALITHNQVALVQAVELYLLTRPTGATVTLGDAAAVFNVSPGMLAWCFDNRCNQHFYLDHGSAGEPRSGCRFVKEASL